MDYHAQNRSEDDVVRMPANGSLYKNIEERWTIFKEEPHNVRISLAMNGVNPFAEMRSLAYFCYQ